MEIQVLLSSRSCSTCSRSVGVHVLRTGHVRAEGLGQFPQPLLRRPLKSLDVNPVPAVGADRDSRIKSTPWVSCPWGHAVRRMGGGAVLAGPSLGGSVRGWTTNTLQSYIVALPTAVLLSEKVDPISDKPMSGGSRTEKTLKLFRGR